MDNFVTLKLFDLSRGMVKACSELLLGKTVDGIWHTNISVFGMDYFYGGGIQCQKSDFFEESSNMKCDKVINLGATEKSYDEFQRYLESVQSFFNDSTYDLFSWNCNHFSNECAKFLLSKSIPDDILNQHKVLLSSPLGKQLMNIISKSNVSNPVNFTSGDTINSKSQININQTSLMNALGNIKAQLNHSEFLQFISEFTNSIECLINCTVSETRNEFEIKLTETVKKYVDNNNESNLLSYLKTKDNNTFDLRNLEAMHNACKLFLYKLNSYDSTSKLSNIENNEEKSEITNTDDNNDSQGMNEEKYHDQLKELCLSGYKNLSECQNILSQSNGNLNDVLESFLNSNKK